MDYNTFKSLVEAQAKKAGVTPEELVRQATEVLDRMNDLPELVPDCFREFAEASKRISQQSAKLRERVKNGTQRTPGNIRLPL